MTQRNIIPLIMAMGIATCCFTLAATSLADPNPPIAKESYRPADVIADVRVISTDCEGAGYETYSSRHGDNVELYNYVSRLEILHLERAPSDSGIQTDSILPYLFDFVPYYLGVDYSEFSPESQNQGVLPTGWVGRVHLRLVPDGSVLAFRGGAVADSEQSQPSELPQCDFEDDYECGCCTGEVVENDDPADAWHAHASRHAVDHDGQGSEQVQASCSLSRPGETTGDGLWFTLPLLGLLATRRRRKASPALASPR